MTGPDYTHGYLRIPLGVWREIYCRAPLTRRHLQLVSVVIRESWGWQTQRGEPYDWTRPLTTRQLAGAAGLTTDHVARDLRALVATGVLRQRDGRYQLVADLSLWITTDRRATKARHAATKAQRDAAQTALAAPGVKKAKKSNRNVAAAVDNSAVAPAAASVTTTAVRLVAVIGSFAGPLAPADAARLRQRIESDGVATVWQALEPWLRRGGAQAQSRVRALVAERNRGPSPGQAAFALEDDGG